MTRNKEPQVTDAAAIAEGMSEAQKRMLVMSEPDDITGREGCGVELCSGAAYSIAKALTRKGLGDHDGPGGFLPGMYWSNGFGLAVRKILQERAS